MNVLIEWTEEFSVENEIIDNQHKQLIDMINELYEAFTKSQAKEIVLEILTKMAKYTIFHFQTESKLFKKFNYSDSETHNLEHQKFVEQVLEFKKRYKKGDDLLSYDLMSFLQEWLANHIVVSDKKYIEEVSRKM